MAESLHSPREETSHVQLIEFGSLNLNKPMSRPQKRKQTITGYIPKEVIIEILSWASVKTLLRLRCVCKSWKSLFSDASFIRKNIDHMDNNHSRHHLLFTDRGGTQLQSISIHSLLCSKDFISIPDPTKHDLPLEKTILQFIQPVASCNGLVLLFNLSAAILLLWNPSIRETKILPDFDQERHHIYYHQFGIGFDPLSNDYKVIEVSSCSDPSHKHHGQHLWLYSLKANSWKRIQDFPYKFELMFHFKIVGNIVFWVRLLERTVVSFDFIKETFHELPLPLDVEPLNLELSGSAKNVYLLYRNGSYVDMWRLNEYRGKESWCKQFTFVHPKEIEERDYVTPELLHVSRDEVMLGHRKGAATYSKLNGMYRVSFFHEDHSHRKALAYVESLVSLKR